MHTISFPGLGIGPFQLNSVAFTLPIGDGIPIMWYAIFIITGMIFALFYASYRGSRFEKIETEHYLDLFIWTLLIGVLGARIYYVAMEPSRFNGFLDFLNLRTGGLAIYGGVIGGVLAIFGVCKVKKLNFFQTVDSIAPGVLVAQAIGRWGNFFNGEAYGSVVSEGSPLYFLRMGLLPNMDSSTVTYYYHPTFLYESLWNLLGFVLINAFYKHKKYNGQVAIMYFTWYGFGRMFIEGLRTDSLYVGPFRASQVLAFLCFIAGTVALLVLGIRLGGKNGKETAVVLETASAAPDSETKPDAATEPEPKPEGSYTENSPSLESGQNPPADREKEEGENDG